MSTIPFDQMHGFIWVNGQSIDWQDAKIHVLTHGLHYGSSVFEGIRVYNGKPFKLKEHLERLHHSAKCLGFEVPFSIEQLCQATIKQIDLNNIKNGYVRPVAWRGTETMLIGGGSKIANVAIAAWSTFEDKRKDLRTNGTRMCISKWRKPNPDASPYSSKAASIYTLCTIAKNDATTQGFDDAIMLDSEDNVTEGTTSNIFFIKDEKLFTPIPDRFLNGITRQTVIKLANDLGYEVSEIKISLDSIKNYDSAFLTGTAIEIMQIKEIDKKEFTINHPVYKRLCDEFTNLVMSSI
jgi:branched-chain amino acid aminotransferase